MIRDTLSPRTERAVVLYAAIYVGLFVFWMVAMFRTDPVVGTLHDEIQLAILAPAVVAVFPVAASLVALRFVE